MHCCCLHVEVSFTCTIVLYMLLLVHCSQVWQVRNASLWQAFQVHKRMMKEKLGRDTERWLWHGAAEKAIESINKEGFNRSYSGRNGIRTPASSTQHLQCTTRYSLTLSRHIHTYIHTHTLSFFLFLVHSQDSAYCTLAG